MALLNRAKMSVSGTPGTGTITLDAAVTGCASLAEAGAVDGTTYTYVIEDGTDFEIGHGTYTASGTTLSRDTVLLSKISGTAGTTKLTLTSNATVAVTIAKEDFDGFATAAQGAKADGAAQKANNLSDLADAATARTNLGLAIGSDVQAYDAQLFHNLPLVSINTDLTLVAAHKSKTIIHHSDADQESRAVTLNKDVFSLGDAFVLFNWGSGGNMVLTRGTDVHIHQAGAAANDQNWTIGEMGYAVVQKLFDGDYFIISGVGIS